jgi:hypothetical protein
MLTKFGSDRIGHDLAPVDLSRLTPANCGVPAHLPIGMNGHIEIAGANPLLHDFFELACVFFCLFTTGSFRRRRILCCEIGYKIVQGATRFDRRGCPEFKN